MANAVGTIGGHPKGWRGEEGRGGLSDGRGLEVEPGPCVLLSWGPEAELGQTTNRETRAVLIAMVKQEIRQLVLKSVFRPGVQRRRSFRRVGSAEGSEEESTCPKAESVPRFGSSERRLFPEQGVASKQRHINTKILMRT